MLKLRLNFDTDEWLTEKLEDYQTQHKDLESNKDLVQSYIRSLLDKIAGLGPVQTENKSLEQQVPQSQPKRTRTVWENGKLETEVWENDHWVTIKEPQATQQPPPVQIVQPSGQKQLAQTDPTVNRWMKAYLERDAIEEAKFQQNFKRLKQIHDEKLEFEEAKTRLRKQERREGHGQGRSGQWEEPRGASFFYGEGA